MIGLMLAAVLKAALPVSGEVELACDEPKGWTLAVRAEKDAVGREVVTVTAENAAESAPPAFTVSFHAPGAGVHHVWTSAFDQEGFHLWPEAWKDWKIYRSELASECPLAVAFDGNGRAKLAMATSEAFEHVAFGIAANESTCELLCRFRFFTKPAAPRTRYAASIVIDRRDAFWADAVRGTAEWIAATSGFRAAEVPEAAYDPLYSTWYAYMQDVHADELEREAPLAAALGMRTMILDDGWQKVKSKSFYSATGDWNPVPSRFPDMKAHVAAVHKAGLRYMLWFGVPLIGNESKAWAKFKDKLLGGWDTDTGILDPRFPEVREYLIGLYERAVRDWGFDGLKLDFIDSFALRGKDPVDGQGMNGRDIREVPQAVDRLMKDILARLRAIRPNVLIEFRQHYIGPAIRQYGNMLRAADCPVDPPANRRRIADLRLTAGTTAVHADMLVWSPDETPAGAARPILSAIFGTIQYSMILQKIPAAHRAVIRHWLDFSQKHRATLLKGAFRPHHPEAGYPLIEAEGADERIVAVYLNGFVAPLGRLDRPVYVLNGSPADRVTVDSPTAVAAEAFGPDGAKAADLTVPGGCSAVTVPSGGYLLVKPCAASADVVIENARFRLVAGADAKVRSLVLKATGEECANGAEGVPLFSVTQDRPFNNEVKLIHPNKRTTYPANALRREGDRLVVGFAIAPYEAVVGLKATDAYVEFRLEGFRVDKEDYDDLKMDQPPVASFRVLQIPVLNRRNFGDWLNASWDEKSAIGVVGTSPYPDIDHEARNGFRILTADLVRGQKLKGGSAALVAANGREDFLDCMDALEEDFDLPRGVKSRRSDAVRAFIYHTTGPTCPANIDKHIEWAKRGGFKYMTFGTDSLCKSTFSWGLCGDYDLKDDYTNGFADVKAMLAKVKAAGITPGLHFLHTHIGMKSRYVTPVADPRLNKTRRFTLAKPLDASTNATEVAVLEPTEGAPEHPGRRVLQFGGELLSYEGFTTEPPYRFLGVRRGAWETTVTAHPRGEIGGTLDVSEYGKPMSCYIDQNTDLQEEVSAKIAALYDCGFEYAYFDGSEGVNAPCNFHVSNAQYRQWKLFGKKPLFSEGAAKTHFDWHILSGANAFDCFGADVFKRNIVRFPVAQAPISWQDMTRVNFGWWAYWIRGRYEWWGRKSVGTKPGDWQFACSQCLAWDCPATVSGNVELLEADRANAEACFEVMRLWEEARSRKLLTREQKEMLKDVSREYRLSIVDGKAILTETKD